MAVKNITNHKEGIMSTRFHTLMDLLCHLMDLTHEAVYKKRIDEVSYSYMIDCPIHNGENHAVILEQVGNKIHLHCIAGCRQKHILEALDLRPEDLILGGTEFRYPKVTQIEVTFECVDNEGNFRRQQVCYLPKTFELQQLVGFVQGMHDINFATFNDCLLKDWGFEIHGIKASEPIEDDDDQHR